MPRKKLITTEELIRLTDLYCAENIGKTIKVSDFTLYVQQHGYPNVEAYLIRRDREFMAYKDKINKEYEKRSLAMIPVYRNLDLDKIFSTGKSEETIKKTLKARENYYCELAKSAATVANQNKKLSSEVKEKEETIRKLNEQLKSSKDNSKEIRRLKKELASCKELAGKLKNIIETNVQPEIANAILARDGISRSSSEILSKKALDDIIDADTCIDCNENQKDEKKSLKDSLLSAFDD